jgi:RNA 2',3'-cyclic 3'-phosphodiesterase
MNLRLFIAIDLPEQIKEEISELIEILKKYDADVKWIIPGNLHLTLKFLGSTADTLPEKIRDSLLPVVSSYEPFYITIEGTGVFPGEKRPRVLWTGIVDSDHLKALRDSIDRTLSLLGFPKDVNNFHPHLTLGRVRTQQGMISLMKELRNSHEKLFGKFLVDRIKLMKSDLKPKGPEYTCLNELPLGIKGIQ